MWKSINKIIKPETLWRRKSIDSVTWAEILDVVPSSQLFDLAVGCGFPQKQTLGQDLNAHSLGSGPRNHRLWVGTWAGEGRVASNGFVIKQVCYHCGWLKLLPIWGLWDPVQNIPLTGDEELGCSQSNSLPHWLRAASGGGWTTLCSQRKSSGNEIQTLASQHWGGKTLLAGPQCLQHCVRS